MSYASESLTYPFIFLMAYLTCLVLHQVFFFSKIGDAFFARLFDSGLRHMDIPLPVPLVVFSG